MYQIILYCIVFFHGCMLFSIAEIVFLDWTIVMFSFRVGSEFVFKENIVASHMYKSQQEPYLSDQHYVNLGWESAHHRPCYFSMGLLHSFTEICVCGTSLCYKCFMYYLNWTYICIYTDQGKANKHKLSSFLFS